MRKLIRNTGFWLAIAIPVLTATLLISCSKSDEINQNDLPNAIEVQSTLKAAINPKANADAVYNGFLNAFKVTSGGQTYFVNSLSDRGRAYFWNQGIMITSMCDAYDANPTAARKQLVTDLLNAFLANEGTDWTWNKWNDDIAWVCIPLARGYLITGNIAFRDAAAKGWNMMYNRGWDSALGGGIWENQDKQTKNALSTNPNIIAGIFLYQATNDAAYLTKCRAIYAWVKGNLLASDGHINGAVTSGGVLQTSDNAYDDGSFVNAGAALYNVTKEVGYLNESKVSADHIKNKWPILNQEGDAATRGIAKLARENNLGSTYYPWLANNCAAAWNNRRTDYNITWNNWTSQTPNETNRYCMEYVSAVTVQMVTPEQGGTTIGPNNGTYKVISRQNGLALTANGTANLSTLNVSTYTGSNSQRWTVTSLGNGNFKLIGVASGRSIDVSGASTTDGASIILWDYQNSSNQTIYFTSPASGYYTMFFLHSGKVADVNGANNSVAQWVSNGGNNQQWQFLAP